MIVIGIGCKKGIGSDEILSAISAAREKYAPQAPPHKIATIADKQNEQGIIDAAKNLGIPIVFLSQEQLTTFAKKTLTSSDRVMELKAVPSVAETAALAAAGEQAELLGPRLVVGPVTCAIAEVN